MTAAEPKTPRFKIGDRVVDRSGFEGTIREITFYNGGHWYDVRLPGGVAVRYDDDLKSRP